MANPSLTPKKVRKIEALIRAWNTELTMKKLIAELKLKLGITTTRQTLYSYISIKKAYQTRKKELRGQPKVEVIEGPQDNLDLLQRIERLKAENKALLEKAERQTAFIVEIAKSAKNNPSVMEIMNNIKAKLK